MLVLTISLLPPSFLGCTLLVAARGSIVQRTLFLLPTLLSFSRYKIVLAFFSEVPCLLAPVTPRFSVLLDDGVATIISDF